MRRGQADEEFLAFLEADDMDQVKEYILRLEDLDDEDGKLKKRICVKALSSHLSSRIKALNGAWSSMLLDQESSVSDINRLVSLIDTADAWIDGHVGRLPAPYPGASSWSLAEEFAGFKSHVNASFDEHVTAAINGIDKWDMQAAAVSSRRASLIESAVANSGQHLRLDAGERTEQLGRRITQLADSTENEVNDFLASLLANGAVERSEDTTRLPSQMKTLCLHLDEMSKTRAHGCDNRFGEIYGALQQKLSHGMGELLNSLESDVHEKRFARPVAVLQILLQESGSLDKHIDFPISISEKLAETTALKGQHYRSMSEGECKVSRVDSHLEILDALAKNCQKWSVNWWKKHVWLSDYDDHHRSSLRFAEQIVTDTKAVIERLEFSCLRKRLEVIDRIRAILSVHLNLDNNFGLEVLRVLATRRNVLVREMIVSLQRNSLDHFWVLFGHFYSLMSEFPRSQVCDAGILVRSGKELSDFAQKKVHEVLLAHCRYLINSFNREINTFNFGLAAQAAKKLRSWGFFMCSLFELYRFIACAASSENDSIEISDDNFDDLINVVHDEFGGGKILEIGRAMAVLHLASSSELRISRHDVQQACLRQSALFQSEQNMPESSKRGLEQAKALLENESNLEYYQDYDFNFLTTALATLQPKVLHATEKYLEDGEYASVESLYAKLDDIPALLDLVSPSHHVQHEELQNKISHMVEKRAHGLSFDVRKAWKAENLKDVYHSFVELEGLQDIFKQHGGVLRECHATRVVSELQVYLDKMRVSFTSLQGKDHNTAIASFDRIVRELIQVGKIMDGFPRLKTNARNMIEETLTSLQEEPWGVSFVFSLGLKLEKFKLEGDPDGARIGQVLVSTFPHFDNVRLAAWHRAVIPSPPAENLKSFRAERINRGGSTRSLSINKGKLEKSYKLYEEHFNDLFHEFITLGPDDLVRKVYSMLSEFGHVSVEAWDDRLKNKLVEIVAGVFATFTIIKSGDSFNHLGDKDLEGTAAQQVLFRPHSIQVLSIFHLLGIGDDGLKLRSHVMEILTGEGKSLALGVLALVLALLGFSVRCVCYSEHLCARDHDLFQALFSAFAVTDRIKYSTIRDMAATRITGKCDVFDLTVKLLNGRLAQGNSVAILTASTGSSRSSSRAQGSHDSPLALNGEDVLLVDEVDVFFGRDFYGETLNMFSCIQSSSIDRLIQRMWNERANGVHFSWVQNWAKYHAVIGQYSEWKYQIDTEIGFMCQAFPETQWRPYEVDAMNMRIGYRDKDSVDWNFHFGYETMFAALKQQENGIFRGERADQVVKREMSIHIMAGHFSYARISPTRILGVSGTISSLSQGEREIVRNFGVETFSYTPSVYGPNNRQFDKCGRGVSIEVEQNRYFQALANAAHDAAAVGAAALIVFQNDERLKGFLATSYGKELKQKQANVLESTLDKSTRQYVINRAATSGQVTLTTAIFGRGTDFFSQDPKLEEAGGLRVIQSFLSVEKSEEIQIMGRTGRQGKKGSYQMILLESDLCALLRISANDLNRLALEGRYEWLDHKRQAVHQEGLTDLTAKVQAADERHAASVRYANALEQGNKTEAKKELDAIYNCMYNHH